MDNVNNVDKVTGKYEFVPKNRRNPRKYYYNTHVLSTELTNNLYRDVDNIVDNYKRWFLDRLIKIKEQILALIERCCRMNHYICKNSRASYSQMIDCFFVFRGSICTLIHLRLIWMLLGFTIYVLEIAFGI